MSKFTEQKLFLKNTQVVLREATPTDAKSIIDFLTVISNETPFTYNYPGQQLKLETMTNRLSSEQSSPLNLRVIAVEDFKVIGQIFFWRLAPDHPWLQHKGEFAMMVVKAWWGSGLAKALLASMEAFARSTGAKRIDATVSCSNERGVSLYSKNGFVIEGTAKGYKIVDGVPLDSYFIAKYL